MIWRGIAFPFLEQPLDSGLFERTRQLAANGKAALSERGFRLYHHRQGKTAVLTTFSLAAAVYVAWIDRISVRFPRKLPVTRELTLERSLPSVSFARDLPFLTRTSIGPDLAPSLAGLGISAPYSR